MSLSAKKILLAAAVESTYGTAATLTGANCVRTRGLEIMPFEAEAIDRELDGPTLGASQRIHVGMHVKCKFQVELVGSGTLGTAPAFGDLLQGCHMLETVVASTSVEYTPNSNDTTSLTLRVNIDGIDHLIVGAQGNFRILLDANQIPYLEFELTGLYADPTSTAALDPTTGWATYLTPEPVSFAATTAFQLYGVNTGWQLRSFELDCGNDVQYFSGPGEDLVDKPERESTGKLTVLTRTIGTFNPFAQARQNNTGALLITHGTVTARRWHLSAPAVQILSPKYGDDRNRLTTEADLVFVGSADNDFKLRFASAAS